MTTYEAITVALQSNLVLISVITLILIFVKERKK
ncbi:putative holin-like toxin [Desertibacillus haloalkaliphilus]|nr:putative holin-like toxin [Desertibacillus haloalkaliphilus]